MPPGILPQHRGLSGDIIVQFNAVKPFNLGVLQARVELTPDLPPDADVEVVRLIGSLSAAEVAALEAGFPVARLPISLNALFRVRLRGLGLHLAGLESVRAWLAGEPRVASAWLELGVSLASQLWWEPGFAPEQTHLTDAPDGVGARAFWARRGGAGALGALYAIEHGWALDHQDLKGREIPAPLTGDNAAKLPVKDGLALRRINHGTSALSVAVGCDDAPGRIGVAPAVAGVWVSSAYDAARDVGDNVASAITRAVQHAVQGGRRGAVLMLQVQRGLGLPVEVDLGDFLAIRLAVLHGLTVVEPAGNGACDLSMAGWPESGAVVVGALNPGTQTPLPNSNHGARVDCYAQGAGVRCSGAPLDARGLPDRSGGPISASRRDDFGRTSAATAVVAGVALCLVGRTRALGQKVPSSLDIRGWLQAVASAAGAPDLSQITDATTAQSGARLGPLKNRAQTWPWRNGAKHPFGPLTVSNPQTGEGNTNLVQTDLNGNVPDSTIGHVRLPPLPGTGRPHALSGGSPPGTASTDPAWEEHWVLHTAATLTNPPETMLLRHDAGDTTSNPGGEIWGSNVVQYFKGLPAYNANWKTVTMPFRYVAIPPAPSPALDDTGWNLLHFDVHRSSGGGWQKVGELRRRIQGDLVEERWALYDNYLFAEPGADVLLWRRSSVTNSTQDWLAANYQARNNSSPRPYWFVNTGGSLQGL